MASLLRKIISLFKKTEPTEEFQKASDDEHIITLGRYAGELLKNPAFDACFNKIEEDILNAWKTSAPKDKDARENLYYRIEGLAHIKVKLQGMINNMMYEESKLKKESQKK